MRCTPHFCNVQAHGFRQPRLTVTQCAAYHHFSGQGSLSVITQKATVHHSQRCGHHGALFIGQLWHCAGGGLRCAGGSNNGGFDLGSYSRLASGHSQIIEVCATFGQAIGKHGHSASNTGSFIRFGAPWVALGQLVIIATDQHLCRRVRTAHGHGHILQVASIEGHGHGVPGGSVKARTSGKALAHDQHGGCLAGVSDDAKPPGHPATSGKPFISIRTDCLKALNLTMRVKHWHQ